MTEVEQNPKPKYTRQARWRERNPKAVWAHVALKSAMRRGLIEPQPCEVCGAAAEGHHDDYDRPMVVRWFCRRHHKAEHRRLRAEDGEVS
jgi:hypothetical protein